MTSGDLTFDLTKKLTEVISSLFLTLFRTPPSAYRYVAQEPSYKGGCSNTPPQQGVEIQDPQQGAG